MQPTDTSKDLNAFQAACGPEKKRMAFRAQVTAVAVNKTKNDSPYFAAEFADAAGTVKLKAWNNSPAAPWANAAALALGYQPGPGEGRTQDDISRVMCVEVSGVFSKGDFGVESNDWTVRALTEEERAEFFLGSAEVRAKQERDWRAINEFVAGMQDRHFRVLCETFLRERGAEFRRAAAARGNHHARPGGLVEHVAGMMRAASLLARSYGETLGFVAGVPSDIGYEEAALLGVNRDTGGYFSRTAINRDLLLAGVLFHDCGKLVENQYVRDSFEMPFTQAAEMLGHIAIGFEWVEKLWARLDGIDTGYAAAPGAEPRRTAESWPSSKLLHLKHLILSHHGTLEWGSPVVPKTYEAMLLHFIDNMDAKMEMLRGAREKGREIAPGIIEKVWPMGASVVTPRWEETE